MQLKCIRVKNLLPMAPPRTLCNILEIATFFGIFLLLLVCNWLTPYFADDFGYCYSYQNGELLNSVFDIFPSMWAHAASMNGRLVAHGLVQLFTMFPNWVFDLVNAAMFTMQIYLVSTLVPKGYLRCLLNILVFFSFLLFELSFGQVNLWQDGAVNYLWSGVFGLLFLKPFVHDYLSSEEASSDSRWRQGLVLLGGFCVGAYSETVSAAAIFCGALLVFAQWYSGGQKRWNTRLVALLAAAMVGYVTIYLAPAQWTNKSVDGTLGDFIYSFLYAGRMYLNFWVLLLAFVVLFFFSVWMKADQKRLFLAVVFLAGSLVANFMLAFAAYYPERSAVGAFVFLVCADAILCGTLLEDRKAWLPLLAATLVLICCSAKPVYYGGLDILRTYRGVRENIQTIEECREAGILDISLPLVEGRTKFSAAYFTKYLDTQDSTSWPNASMARHYGVNSIIGIADDE